MGLGPGTSPSREQQTGGFSHVFACVRARVHACMCVCVCACGQGEHGMAIPSPGDRSQNAPSGCPSVPGRRWPSLGGAAT